MKKFKNLLVLSIFILLSSCGQTVDYDDEKEYLIWSNPYSKGPRVLSYKGLPFNGELVEYFDDEKTQLKERRDYKEGKIDGQYEKYYSNGQLEENVTYKEGIKDGISEEYDFDTVEVGFDIDEEVIITEEIPYLRIKQYYKDGKLNGPYVSYYDKENIVEKVTYINGKKEGFEENFWFGGDLHHRVNYINGNREGSYVEYHVNDSIDIKSNYKNDVKHGTYEEYYENGKLKQKCEYINNFKFGRIEHYFENGQIHKIVHCNIENSRNYDGPYEEYYENGQLKIKTNYKVGYKKGGYEEYNENGKLIKKTWNY